MVPGLLLSKLMQKWRDQLVGSESVGKICFTKFGKKPKILVGVDAANPPTSADCPYIIIQPVFKREGVDWKQYRYSIEVKWAVVNSEKLVTGEITELTGLYDCDELGQAILTAISQASSAHPVSYVKYQLSVGELNTFTGSMEVRVYVIPAMGSVLSY